MDKLFDYNIKDIKKYSIYEILNERENRVRLISLLEEKYKCTIISLRVNYPGENKCNNISIGVCTIIGRELLREFKNYLNVQWYLGAEGPIFIMAVHGKPYEIKKAVVSIEDKHPLGRLVDIDVYSQGRGISRKDLNMPPRKVLITAPEAENIHLKKLKSL